MILRPEDIDPESRQNAGLFFVPDEVSFGEDEVDALNDDQFLDELMGLMAEPVDPDFDYPVWSGTSYIQPRSPLTEGGPAILPEDEDEV